MRLLTNLIKNRGINYEYIGLLILTFFPIFPYFLVSVSILLYAILVVFDYFSREKAKINLKSRLYIIKTSGFYFFLIATLFFRPDFFLNLKELQASIVILVIPLTAFFFSRFSISANQKQQLLKAFVFSSFLLGLVIILASFIDSLNRGIPFFEIVKNSSQEIRFLDIHPVYTSLYFALSILYLLSSSKYSPKKKLILIVFFSSLILMLSARIVIVALLFLLLIKLFKNNQKTIYIKVIYFISIFVLLAFTIHKIPSLNKGFKEISSISEFQLPHKKFPTSSQIRLGIYDCSFEIIKGNWLFGKQPHKFGKDLDDCYDKYGNYDKIHYNTHNYFLNLLCIGGVICVLLFIYSIIVQYKKAKENKDALNMSFVFLIMLSSLTENILSRSYGSIFFVLFLLLFSFTETNKTSDI